MTKNSPETIPEKSLSRAEWELMNICWRRGTVTARQVLEESATRRDRDYQTIKTLLDRITSKGYLRMEKLGPLCLYTPAVERRLAIGEAVRDFVDVVLERSAAPLMIQLAREEELTDEEVRELESLLARRKAKD